MPGWKKKAPGSWLDRRRSTDSAGIGKTADTPLRVVADHVIMQRLFPSLFKGSSHQPVLWFRDVVLAKGTVRVVTGTLQSLLPMRVQPLSLRIQVRDGLQAEIQGGRLQRSQNLLSDQCVHNSVCKILTTGVAIHHLLLAAHVSKERSILKARYHAMFSRS